MADLAEVKRLIDDQGVAIQSFKREHLDKVDALRADFDAFVAGSQRPGAGGVKVKRQPEQWIDTKSGRPVMVLDRGDSLAAMEEKKPETEVKLGRLLRGLACGGHAPDAKELAEERKAMAINANPDGGYTVGGILASQWIDLLRARMVLTQAGARTIPMEAGSMSIARVTADPAISWHGENAALTAVQPTLGAVYLNAKTATCLVKLSLELAQDSANIEQILQGVISNAMAAAIDSAGMNGVSTDEAAAPGGLFNLTGRNSVTSIGAPTSWDYVVDGMYELMVDNVPMESIGGLVAHPAVWKKMRKLKTGIASDNTPLTMPAEVAALPKLWTTAAPLAGGTTAKGMIADWRDLLFGVRKSITVRVLQEAFMASNLQIAVLAYARVDFAATRAASFCSLEGITV